MELGCGTGALLEEVATRFISSHQHLGKNKMLAGIDHNTEFIDQSRLLMKEIAPGVEIKVADATSIPYPEGTFEVVYCHYFLMWNEDQKRARVVQEAKRVLKTGGWFVCFAEPDYLGWILEPETKLREFLMHSLMVSGGDLSSGRKLVRDLAGFKDVVIDCCSQPWTGATLQQTFATEWNFYENLLADKEEMVEALVELKQQDLDATTRGIKLSFLPVFYGYGRK